LQGSLFLSIQVVRRPYIFVYNNEFDIVERGLVNLSTSDVKLIDDLDLGDGVSLTPKFIAGLNINNAMVILMMFALE
jgi:hypothetical protein